MAKGLKMEAARKKDFESRVFNIGQLSKSDNGNLKCRFCDAEVQYVSAHTKGASKTPIAAYLKLWQEENHNADCGYSVKGAVEQLVADSNAVEDISPIFELQEDGSCLFRMNILVDAQRVAKDSLSIGNDHNGLVRQFDGRNYVRTERRLASYFRSASGIAKLRALVQDSSDVELLGRLVKIQHKDNFISWNDFYYDESRYHVLFNRLERSKLFHPVAVKVTAKGEVNYYAAAKYFPWSFQCYSETIYINGSKRVIIPRLQLAKERFANQISLGDTYLVVGEAWVSKAKDEKSIFRNFNISVFNKSQFTKEIDASNVREYYD